MASKWNAGVSPADLAASRAATRVGGGTPPAQPPGRRRSERSLAEETN